MIPGLTPIAGSLPKPYVGNLTTHTDIGDATISDIDIGPAGKRHLALVFSVGANFEGSTSTIILVDGNAVTTVVDADTGGDIPRAHRVYIIEWPTGTTVDISVNVAGDFTWYLGVIPIYNLASATATDTDSDLIANPVTLNMDIAGCGVFVGIFTLSGTVTFTNVDATLVANSTYAGYHENGLVAVTSETFQASTASGGIHQGAGATFR